jgi:phospholipid/cholesterol/gamma-HCH transport system substrate-binding protein
MSTETNKRPLILGLFIFLGLAIIVAGIFSVGSQSKYFQKKFVLTFMVNDAEGLQPGHNVWLFGVKVGAIQKIVIQPNNLILISMNIEKKIQTHIFRNARVKISSDGFIGNKIAVIMGGSPSSGIVADGDMLQNEKQVSVNEMMTMLQTSNKNILEITNNFRSISHKLDSGKGSLGGLINDNELLINLQHTISNFKNTSHKTDIAVDNISAFTYRLNHDTGFVNKIISDTSLYQSLLGSSSELKAMLASLGMFTNELKNAGEKLNQNESTLGMLMNDSTVAKDIRNIMINLRSSSEKLDQDLEALQHNFLFRGYFRKKKE